MVLNTQHFAAKGLTPPDDAVTLSPVDVLPLIVPVTAVPSPSAISTPPRNSSTDGSSASNLTTPQPSRVEETQTRRSLRKSSSRPIPRKKSKSSVSTDKTKLLKGIKTLSIKVGNIKMTEIEIVDVDADEEVTEKAVEETDESVEENVGAIPFIGDEGNRIINGIKRTGEDLYRVYQAPVGDVSPSYKTFLGLSPLGRKDWSYKELLEHVNITDDYCDMLKKTPIGNVARMIGSNEGTSQLDSSEHFSFEPFGTELPTDMFDDTRGCTLVSLLFCIPSSKIKEIGCAKLIALFDHASTAYDMTYKSDDVFLQTCLR